MKRILLALTILATAGVCFFALSRGAVDGRQQLRAAETEWRSQTQQLAEIQAAQAALAASVRELRGQSDDGLAHVSVEPALAYWLLTNDINSASLEMQEQILAKFGRGENSSAGFLLVSKAALKTATLGPLKSFPDASRLSDAVCGVLAITPDERQTVEAAFGQAFETIGTWAKANVQRDGPSGEMLVRYTIPADQSFERASTEKLFSNINAAVGEERGQMLRDYFQTFRIYEDGAIGDRTNLLEIHRLSGPPGLGYRAGWKWTDSEAINTYPEPIKPNKFPAAFNFIFPGGWQEIADREGFELPEELKGKR